MGQAHLPRRACTGLSSCPELRGRPGEDIKQDGTSLTHGGRAGLLFLVLRGGLHPRSG